MTSFASLEVQSRQGSGTGAARATRRAGFVPGIVYGNKKDPISISVEPKALMKELSTAGFFSRVYNLSVDGKPEQVLAKAIQMHPVTDRPIHVDFLRVAKDAKVHVWVPIHFINEDKSPGIKRGGVLNIVHHTLELICPVTGIPDSLDVDLTGADIAHAFHLDAVELPKGVVAAHPERDNTLGTIVAPTVMQEEEKPAEESAEAAEAAAPEPAASE